ncbi:Ulp1 protease family protein [Pochonia chlamydosporia 170]|uniref:Ulp1 protease family protein n=1 Tax=Pochonia chlamydosporia 170 TaxID=1380566 RepID=A0A179FHC3_METCM|nr:Ulp1 protease family protein [Pochonia chlamydosporia 170]OAQ64680.2 Ulp1 protease family protein [Pochonia chlamydosporia 170]
MPVNPFIAIDAGSTFNFGPAANFLQKSPATPESLVQRKSAVPHAKRPRRSPPLPVQQLSPPHDNGSDQTKLDHPPRHKGSDINVVAPGKSKQKSSWDPLARYHSEANSFPDYGNPSDEMSSRRMREINRGTAGGLNTLTRPPRPLSMGISSQSPQEKRQKDTTLSPPDAVFSPYFANQRDAKIHDLTGSSQDDAWELRSTSSSGKHKAFSGLITGVEELHPKGPNVLSKPRVRKSRSSSAPKQILESARQAHIIDVEEEHLHDNTHTVQNPDELEEAVSPPPAKVTSDIGRPANKRGRPSNFADTSSPHVKRTRIFWAESIDSEDELSKDPGPQTRKKTNFSDLATPRRKSSSRGDIPQTQFTAPAKSQRRGSLTANNAVRDLCVRRAVCGKLFYNEDDDQRGQLILQQAGSSTTLVPKFPTDDDATLEWMKLTLDSILRLDHAKGKSHFVFIRRPRSHQSGGPLWLQLADHRDVFNLLKAVEPVASVDTQYCAADELETKWDKAMNRAATYGASHQGKVTKSDDTSSSREANDKTRVDGHKDARNGNRSDPRLTRIIDKLTNSAAERENGPDGTAKGSEVVVSQAPTTRRTRRSSPVYIPRELSPDRWTRDNPGWRERWHKSLVFPTTGKNRATVDDNDISRLDEGEFLNDNLISFYVRYLQFKLESEKPELLNQVYFFSTFFFEKLRSTKGKINYDGVKAWTTKFDLLSYDYIVVPVNENAHWYLAIICNTPYAVHGMPEDEVSKKEERASSEIKTIAHDMSGVSIQDDDVITSPADEPADIDLSSSTKTLQHSSPAPKNTAAKTSAATQQVDSRLPKVITLDSLGSAHMATCRALKEYLIAEAKDKKGVDLAIVPAGMTAKKIPEQDNFCDCGVFVLGYMEEFLKDPEGTVCKLLRKEPLNWEIRPSLLRNQVRNLLFELQDEQQARLEKELAEKRLLSSRRRAAARAGGRGPQEISSPTPVREKLSSRQSGAPPSVTLTPKEPVADSPPMDEQGAGTPTQTKQPSTDDKEVKLTDISNGKPSNGKSTPDDVFYSDRSSPGHKPKNGATDAAEPTELDSPASASTDKSSKDNGMVQTLSESSPEIEAQMKKTIPKAQKSVAVEPVDVEEVTAISPNRVTRQKSKQLESSPPMVQTIRSSQSSSPKKLRARYDGIDRSVDPI